MAKYESLKKRLDLIEDILDEMKDIVYLGQPVDAVDSMTFNRVIETYLKLSKQVDDLTKIVEGVLLCKNDSERLNFFLNNIYKQSQAQ